MMYEIRVDQEMIEDGEVTSRTFTFTTSTEKLHQIVGRFTLKYGTPYELKFKDGWSIIDFFKEYKVDMWISVTINFRKRTEVGRPIILPLPEPKKEDPSIVKIFLAANVLGGN